MILSGNKLFRITLNLVLYSFSSQFDKAESGRILNFYLYTIFFPLLSLTTAYCEFCDELNTDDAERL